MSHFKKRLLLFKNLGFSSYIASCILATIGGGFTYVALTWTVVSLHASVYAVAIMMLMFWLPGVLFGPFIGVMIDRVSRKTLLGFSNATRAIALVLLGFLVMRIHSLALLYCFSFIFGFFFSVYLPAAMTFVREVVPEDQLLYGNATIDMAYEVGNVIGMGMAGAVIAMTSLSLAYFINAICLLTAAVIMFAIPKRHIAAMKSENKKVKDFFKDLNAGLRYLKENRSLCLVYTIQLMLTVLFMSAPVLLAPFAKQVLHLQVDQFGHIEAALSVGVILGGLILPWIALRLSLFNTLIVSITILGIGFVLFGYNHDYAMAEGLYFVIGIALASWPLILTKTQEMTAMEFQGRVMATFNSLMGLCILLMYGFVSVCSRIVSIRHLYWVEFGIAVIAIGLLMYKKREIMH